jgi:hypothetical protein
MALVKAHISLDKDKIDEDEARSKVLAEIRKKADISDVNEKRFRRYGVLSCNVDDKLLDVIRKIPGVAAVEPDEKRRLS